MDDIEITNQKGNVEYLRSEMHGPDYDRDADRWTVRRGYIATSEYRNRAGPGTWTDGIDFVVLDDRFVAYRLSGVWRDDGDWQIVKAEDFRDIVIADAEETLARWQEANEAAD